MAVITGLGWGVYWLSQQTHVIDRGEMSVLVDSRGNVTRDEHNPPHEFDVHSQFYEYQRENQVSANTQVGIRNTQFGVMKSGLLSQHYPIQGYLGYEILDPVQIHLLTRIDAQPGEGKEKSKKPEKKEGEERLKELLEESMIAYMKDTFPKKSADELKKELIVQDILARFQRDYPTGIKFTAFDYRLGAPGE